MTIINNPEYQVQAQSFKADGSLGEFYKQYIEGDKTTFLVCVAPDNHKESAIFVLNENGAVDPSKMIFAYEENGKLRITAADSAHAEVQVFSGESFIDALEMNSAANAASPASDAATELFDRTGGHSFRPVDGFAHPLLHQINLDADLQQSHKQTCPSGNVFSITEFTPLKEVGRDKSSDAEILAEQVARRTR